jgi:hypothetical protein
MNNGLGVKTGWRPGSSINLFSDRKAFSQTGFFYVTMFSRVSVGALFSSIPRIGKKNIYIYIKHVSRTISENNLSILCNIGAGLLSR